MQGITTLDYLHAELRKLLPKANLVPTPLPLLPAVKLYLLEELWPQEKIEAPVINALMEAPPYWTFCWASGQALAWWILENPHYVAGKVVVDVGSGSGIVAIAAAKAGAKRAIACDIDVNARQAAQLNAQANQVSIEPAADLAECLPLADVVTAADILYDPDNMPLLDSFRAVQTILLADSRVPDLNPDGYQFMGTVNAVTWPDISELERLNTVRLFLSATEL